jgi:hypothetical protein
MQVMLYRGSEIVAQGVVEDLATGQAAARIVTTKGASEAVDTTTKVQFVKKLLT